MYILIYMFKTLLKMFYSQEPSAQSNSHSQRALRFAPASTESRWGTSTSMTPQNAGLQGTGGGGAVV